MTELWNEFWASDGRALSAEGVLLHLLVAFVLSQAIAWVYVATHRGVSYSSTQVQSLVLLSLIVTIVMIAIQPAQKSLGISLIVYLVFQRNARRFFYRLVTGFEINPCDENDHKQHHEHVTGENKKRHGVAPAPSICR